MPEPVRGEVWLADLSPTRGHEQTGQRPVLVVSVSEFNRGPAELVVVLPITSTVRPIPLHVIVQPPEGGLRAASRLLTDGVRSISTERLVERWGQVSTETMEAVEERLRTLLGL
ncbi:MAG TPA: type II toxin-antitoxin system PemK/MazF family toxin [Nitrospiraceae bacterium]|nr:type II toxin-antitoxin system PemK/MazF family toxin [Nitrospiraceae bacterium]